VGNWISKAGIPMSHTDQITHAAWRALRADPTVRLLFEGRIDRHHYYEPRREGRFPRLIVASIERTEIGRISRRESGKHRVGIITEFIAPLPGLAEDEPSIDSVLVHLQNVLQDEDGTKYPSLTGAASLVKRGPFFEQVASSPLIVESSDGPGVAYSLGLVATYEYSSVIPGRLAPVLS